jgi:thiol-disulfide isomerase/thioredoxin
VLATDFPGKAIVVSYWASWCTFCVRELALLSAIQSSASDRVQVVAVNIEPMYIFKKNAKGLSIVGKDGRIDTVNIGYSEEELDGIVQSINHAIGADPAT